MPAMVCLAAEGKKESVALNTETVAAPTTAALAPAITTVAARERWCRGPIALPMNHAAGSDKRTKSSSHSGFSYLPGLGTGNERVVDLTGIEPVTS